MSDATVATLKVPVIGDPAHLDRVLARAQKQLEAFDRQYGQVGRSRGRSAPALPSAPAPTGGGASPFAPQERGAQAARDQTLALAQATSRLQAAQGDTAGAAETLRRALNATNRETQQGIAARTQLANMERRAAAEAAGTKSAYQQLAGTIGGLGQALGALGFAVGIQALGQFAIAAGSAAIELERTQAVMQQLAGSQERYNQIVALARENQQLFGGSLTANLQPLNALLQMSNRTGAELETLNQAAQLLLASTPGKGFGDASFSLSEFLGNNGAEAALSLADQFNLNKQALAELASAGNDAETRLAGLFALLEQQGVSQATLNASLTDGAVAFNRLGAAGSDAFINLGSAIATASIPLANFVSSGLEGLNRLISTGQQTEQVAFQVFAGAQSWEEYSARAAFASEQLGAIGERFATLTPAQYAFAEAAIQSGAGIEEAFAQAQSGATAVDLFASALGQASKEGPAAAAALAGMEAQIVANAASSDLARTQTEGLIQAYLDGTISAEQLATGLENIGITAEATAEGQRQAAAAGTEVTTSLVAQAAASREAAAASNADAIEKLKAAAAAELQAERTQTLDDAIRQAAGSSSNAATLASVIAQQYGVEANAVLDLINLYRGLAAARAGGSAPPRATQRQGGLIDDNASAAPNAVSKANERAIASASRLNAIQQQTIAGVGAASGGTKAKSKGSGGGKSDAAKAEERLTQQLADIGERYREQSLSAESRYQERLLAIQEDFAEKRAAAAQDFADQQVESRLDFYKSLQRIDDQGIRQAASAEFEGFAQQAAVIRDTKGADVAALYEAEAARIAAARAERAQAIKDAEADAKKDKSKRGDLEYLKNLDAMEREVEQRRLDRAASGENSLASQEAGATSEAEVQRQQALAAAATTAGDALSEAQAKALGAAEQTNQALRDQLLLLQQTGTVPGAAGGIAPLPAPLPPPPLPAPLPPVPAPLPPPPAPLPPPVAPVPALAVPGSEGPVAVTNPELNAAIAALASAVARVEAAVAQGAGITADAASRGAERVENAVNRGSERVAGAVGRRGGPFAGGT